MFKSELIAAAAEIFDLTPSEILGRGRTREVTRGRFGLYKALRLRGWSYLRIGAYLDRDHATIIYGVRQAEEMMRRHPSYAEKVQLLADYGRRPEKLAA